MNIYNLVFVLLNIIQGVNDFARLMLVLTPRKIVDSIVLFSFAAYCNNHSHYFTWACFFILLLLAAFMLIRHMSVKEAYSNGAQKRKIRASWRSVRRWTGVLAVCFFSGYVLTTIYSSINAIMYVMFVLVGFAWAAINVNSLPMVVEMCKGSDIGKFTGYYYTFSMAAQVVTPILSGFLLRHVSYKTLFPYAAIFVLGSFVTMLFVRHGDVKAEARRGLDAYEDLDA